MNFKKIIKTAICFLFAFAAATVSASSFHPSDKVHAFVKSSSLAENSGSPVNENIGTLAGILQPPVRVNETDPPSFQNFKGHKKHSANAYFSRLTHYSGAFYSSYSLSRINSAHNSPFYIVYHRLTI